MEQDGNTVMRVQHGMVTSRQSFIPGSEERNQTHMRAPQTSTLGEKKKERPFPLFSLQCSFHPSPCWMCKDAFLSAIQKQTFPLKLILILSSKPEQQRNQKRAIDKC
uniref:Uncharacterized protein n=1 Tax=Rhipicephalus zambeziensis TaxID=60191 RepID=A0A224YAC3_9ACAR